MRGTNLSINIEVAKGVHRHYNGNIKEVFTKVSLDGNKKRWLILSGQLESELFVSIVIGEEAVGSLIQQWNTDTVKVKEV